MRTILAVVFLASAAVRADDRPDDILKQAIAAAGGNEALEKYPAGRVVGKGTMSFSGVDTPFTFEQAYHLTGRFRTAVHCDVQGRKWDLLQVVNDGVARQTINGRPVPLTEAALKELQTAAVLNEIGRLSPLLSNRKYTVKLDKKGPEGGLVIAVKGQPDFHCTFDRKSGHLVRIAYKELEPETAKEAEVEMHFDDFKTVFGPDAADACQRQPRRQETGGLSSRELHAAGTDRSQGVCDRWLIIGYAGYRECWVSSNRVSWLRKLEQIFDPRLRYPIPDPRYPIPASYTCLQSCLSSIGARTGRRWRRS